MLTTSELAKILPNERVEWGYTEIITRGNNFTLVKCNSQMIFRYGYDANLERLFVEFRSNRALYVYYEVPKELFNDMNLADSKGKYLNANIKKKFRYERRIDIPSL